MFVVRPTSGLYSQPAWQQPTYEPFSAFLLPRHTARPQQLSRPSHHTRRSCYYPPSRPLYQDGYLEDEVDDEMVSDMDAESYAPHMYHERTRQQPSMEELLLARLQEQRRLEAEETERMYRARVLRERQRQQLEQQLMAERQRRAALVVRQEEQMRRQQQMRQEEERQRREQQQAEQYAVRLQSALNQLLLGRQLESEDEEGERNERPSARLLVRSSEQQAEQSKQAAAGSARKLSSPVSPIAAPAQPASPAPATSRQPSQPAASKASSTLKPTSSSASSRPTIRVRCIPISSPSSASAPTSPMPASVESKQTAPVTTSSSSAQQSSTTASNSKRPAAPSITVPSPTATTTPPTTTTTTTPTISRIRRGSVEIEDVPSSPDRLKLDADEDVWAVEKRLHTPTPTTAATTGAATASTAA